MIVLSGCRQSRDEQDSTAVGMPETPAKVSITPTADVTEVPETAQPPQPTPSPEQVGDTPSASIETASYGYTHQQPDGNRLVLGQGALPEAMVLDIPLSGRPVWVVGAPIGDQTTDGANTNGSASVWAVVMDDGRVQAFIVRGDQVEEIAIEPGNIGELPPLLQVTGDRPALLMPPLPFYGPAPPAVLDQEGSQAVVSPEGVVTILDPQGTALVSAASQPLPDARLLVDEAGRLLFLSQPTTRYNHGIAGDDVEAAAVTLFDPGQGQGAEVVIPVPDPAVIEGIMPLWADLDGDGQREIIVTQSDAQNGAQIVVYDESGERVAQGPAIGLGRRWRHQLAVAPFGPNGEVELVDVLTPHIGGVVEFYQLLGDELQIVAKVPGYTSHVIGSRNMDMALAGDMDGDGNVELLLPNQGRTVLGAIRRTADGAEVVWTGPLGGSLSSNLAAVQLAGDRMVIGAGREDGTLRLWLP